MASTMSSIACSERTRRRYSSSSQAIASSSRRGKLWTTAGLSLTSTSSNAGPRGSRGVDEQVLVARRRGRRAVRRQGRDVEEERLPGGGRILDHPDRLPGQDVVQIIVGLAAVGHDPAVLVERVVVARMGVAGAVPVAPSGRHAVGLGHVAIDVLTEQRGAVAGGLQPGRDGRVLETAPVQLLEPAVGQLVAQDLRVVGILPAQDRGPRRAAEGIADEEVVEPRALVLHQRLGLRHVGVRGDILVVGQDQHDVGPRRVVGDGLRPGRREMQDGDRRQQEDRPVG